ncbi:methyltransferase domain-containing protein [uncultured Azohydromonas sp.]|jgi:Methylase involved in ubiquinone/menaquinone biosynthesis|uniref:class I SAM-dependent methyltransferase n=1 Tax=uncultured Azohydromonas sp. TaxID=487342 RepID=UPI00262C6DE3|nr:methyltransferase domain-containing protein [uncultured Azohydromonas sp.]
MAQSASQAQLDAAWAYELVFVPALFHPWAPQVADAVQAKPGLRVLDVACGTGILAREIHRRTGPGASVAGLDPHPGMLAVAAELAPGIHWEQGVAESIPFADAAFDTVVSQFGLMFFADRLQALREMLRVLVPRGQLFVVVWDALEHIPAYAALVALLERLAGQQAADALRAPFVLGDPARFSELLTMAGADSVAIRTETEMAQFPSIRTMVEADLRGWLPVMGVDLDENQISRILYESERVLAPYLEPAGSVAFEMRAHIATATKRPSTETSIVGRQG